ncbi:dsRBD fold-containing protein [Streptomyces antimycoticus]|uniref:dsRBD fold-containing protein n=1 Tax=Streptomyces antimycoticus TaxID=68175 RepID=UPI003531088D
MARISVDGEGISLTGHGTARCNPENDDVPEIGDELAAGRALHDPGDQLLGAAERDIKGGGGSPRARTHAAAWGWPA